MLSSIVLHVVFRKFPSCSLLSRRSDCKIWHCLFIVNSQINVKNRMRPKIMLFKPCIYKNVLAIFTFVIIRLFPWKIVSCKDVLHKPTFCFSQNCSNFVRLLGMMVWGSVFFLTILIFVVLMKKLSVVNMLHVYSSLPWLIFLLN